MRTFVIIFALLLSNVVHCQSYLIASGKQMVIGILDSTFQEIDAHYTIKLITDGERENIVYFEFDILSIVSEPLVVISNPKIINRKKIYICTDSKKIYYVITIDPAENQVSVLEPHSNVFCILSNPQQFRWYDY